MQDLSKEKKLKQQISALKEDSEKRQWIRIKKTFFVLTGVMCLLPFIFGDGIISDINSITDFLYVFIGVPIVAAVMAALTIAISLAVSLHITSGAIEDARSIARLEGELQAEENRDRYEF